MWSLARNPDRSWWHRHTSLELFWPQTLAPWTTGIESVDVADETLCIEHFYGRILRMTENYQLKDSIADKTLVWGDSSLIFYT